ncbi:Helicase, C-terminal [Kalmanozyma brasiliensis GHG001]|uniref:ATP-dependent DNA helicase n=1 Tax=Kalmanozyma brasiliensis (strain GHG001) TaxID=1365824 RepID=V5F3M7_KALBG|nr:Helicase, C-terminal [Kalmanozyma brasiliensis GHG001]EST10139.1 Helicase, C-terminal [Kalmanozyma brasiliensis GHG001]
MANAADEFDDIDDFDEFDDSALLQLDQIENTLVKDAPAPSTSAFHQPSRIQTLSSISKAGASRAGPQLPHSTSNGSSAWANKAGPSAVASTSAKPIQRVSSIGSNGSIQPASSGVARQMTLFGKPATPSQVVSSSPGHITISSQSALHNESPNNNAASSSCRPLWLNKVGKKTWDREAYLHRENAKNREKDEFGTPIDVDELSFDEDAVDTGDAKGKAKRDWDAGSKYENVVPPAPADPRRNLPPPQPQKCQIDLEAAKTWIYPTNMERRDYQYNIVQKALFNNVLAALPTGLGKTFIAAVVILNFFRWFPEGKILFLAPSRPLVDQQKIACHKICGLPWDCAIDLTGNTASTRRVGLWQSKRIFYMTPQTLENDIRKGSCDPRDVVCVVVDEAHKARGRYAYGNIMGMLMEVNPHFRVLALSATPGKDSDSVQQVVDQLHINHIEIRTEEAIDVQRYMHRKHEEIVNVTLGKDLNLVKENWAKLMQTQMDPLMKAGLLRNQDPVFLHPFAVNAIAKDRSRAGILAGKPWLRSNLSELAHMALSMQYLMEQSIMMFYNRLKERSMGFNPSGKKTASAKQQMYANKNTTFAEIIRELELMQDPKGRILHPKMLKLRNVLSDHFDRFAAEQVHNVEAFAESGHDVLGNTPTSGQLASFGDSSQAETRAMVFCSYRECCDEIVGFLNDSGFKATEFVGQSKSKTGKKGMSQKDQERVIAEFKAGKYNVLVATSIGEEGLDIGSVDLTVCYEAVKDSIRMLQRIGRTGRKREGKIAVLVSEGREQHNWQHSKDNYKAVQKEVDSKAHVELFEDVDRMVPNNISPQVVLKEVEQPEFDPSMVSEGTKATKPVRAKKEPKPKKDPKRNMPEGGDIMAGFRKASTLTKRKRTASSDSDAAPEVPETHSQKMQRLLKVSSADLKSQFDDDLDELDLRPPQRKTRGKRAIASRSSSPPSSPPQLFGRSNGSLSFPTPLALSDGIETPPLPSSSSSSRPLAAIGATTRGKTLGTGLRSSGRSAQSSGTLALRKSGDAGEATTNGKNGSQPKPSLEAKSPRNRGIAIPIDDDDDDEFGVDFTVDLSIENEIQRVEKEAAALLSWEAGKEKIPTSSWKRAGTSKRDSKAMEEDSSSSSVPTKAAPLRFEPHPIMAALMAQDEKAKQKEATLSAQSVLDSPAKSSMGPPDSVPRRAGTSRTKRVLIESPDASSSAQPMEVDAEQDAASSSPIKAPAKRGRRLQKASSSTTRVEADTSPTAAKTRGRRPTKARIPDDTDTDSSPQKAKGKSKSDAPLEGKKGKKGSSSRMAGVVGKKKRKITNSPTSRALFQYEAERSTDEEVHGERDENDSGLGSSAEDDSDREAVGDFMPTQAPRGYHQQSVYMQSMMSQRAPEEFQRVRHGPFPGVGGKFGEPVTPRRRMAEVRRRGQMSSEPRAGGRGLGSEDMYSEDSFVVNDEEEIVYDSDSDALPDSSQF